MIVTCEKNTGATLSEPYIVMGCTRRSMFPVSVGSSYPVFGISTYKSALFVLLSDDADLPNWHPLELFSLSDASIPGGWAFYRNLESGPLQMMIGYKTLIHDLEHYDGLVEPKREALRIFEIEKQKLTLKPEVTDEL